MSPEDKLAQLEKRFDSVEAATGLDLAAIIQGQAVGRGIGAGIADVAPAKERSGSKGDGAAPSASTALDVSDGKEAAAEPARR